MDSANRFNRPPEAKAEQSLETQEESILTEMPTFEQHMRQMQEAENAANEDISDVMESQDLKTNLAENASENTVADLESEEDLLNRHSIAEGDFSAIYAAERRDGKVNTQVESEYFGMANDFINSHDDVKTNSELSEAMRGFSTDLAFVDVSNGKLLQNDNNSLLKNYSELRARLDNPETDPKEKQAISEFFERMGGEDLKFMEERYSANEAEKQPDNVVSFADYKREKQDKENINSLLEDLEESRENFDETLKDFDDTVSKIQELINEDPLDVNSLSAEHDKLIENSDKLTDAIVDFSIQNADRQISLEKNADSLDQSKIQSAQQQINENEKLVSAASKKVSQSSDMVGETEHYLSDAEIDAKADNLRHKIDEMPERIDDRNLFDIVKGDYNEDGIIDEFPEDESFGAAA